MVCIPKQILCGGAHAQGLSSVWHAVEHLDRLRCTATERATGTNTSSPAKKSEILFFIFSEVA